MEIDCSSAEIATCLGVLSYCRPKKIPYTIDTIDGLQVYIIYAYTELLLENKFGEICIRYFCDYGRSTALTAGKL